MCLRYNVNRIFVNMSNVYGCDHDSWVKRVLYYVTSCSHLDALFATKSSQLHRSERVSSFLSLVQTLYSKREPVSRY